MHKPRRWISSPATFYRKGLTSTLLGIPVASNLPVFFHLGKSPILIGNKFYMIERHVLTTFGEPLKGPAIVFRGTNKTFEKRETKESGRDKKGDRKSTRLNSSHSQISYAVFCLKKKKNKCKHGNSRNETH